MDFALHPLPRDCILQPIPRHRGFNAFVRLTGLKSEKAVHNSYTLRADSRANFLSSCCVFRSSSRCKRPSWALCCPDGISSFEVIPSGFPFVRRCRSRQQTVKQYYIGIDIRDGGIDVLAVRGPRNPAHDCDGTLAEIGELSHGSAVNRHYP